jgi:membrane protease YdiL (CAAX protease family)
MEGKVYPTIKNAILLYLLVIGIILGLSISTMIFLGKLNIYDFSSISSILFSFGTIIAYGIVLVIGFIKTERKFNEVFKFNKVSLFLWIAVIIFMAGLYIILSVLDNFLQYILPTPDMFLQNIKPFETFMVEEKFVIVIIITGIGSFSEEMFFRGLILDGLKNNYSKKKAIIISALFFGTTILLSGQPPLSSLPAFIFGLFAAWICINTNSILLCLYMNFFQQVLYIVRIRFRNLIPIRGFSSNNVTPVEFKSLWYYYLTGLAIFILGIILLKKGFEKAKTGAEDRLCTPP